MKKAMNINFHPGRDDVCIDRLFSYLNSHLPVEINQITSIRNHVYLVESKDQPFILKAFSSLGKLKVQEDFTASLRKTGFEQTYSFLRFTQSPLVFQNRFLGCMDYIQPNVQPFTYQSQLEREEGLELLSKFHAAASKLVPAYKLFLSKQDLLEKWQVRAERFQKNRPIVNYFVPKEYTDEILKWAQSSIKGMQNSGRPMGNTVILHGDVAHHNFIRAVTGKLYLIDFDLITIGSEKSDLLQYANRILPFMAWEFESLAKMRKMEESLSDPAFLYGLIYPADIFREWNRIIKLKAYFNPKRVAPLVDMTVNQFKGRKLFVEKVKAILES